MKIFLRIFLTAESDPDEDQKVIPISDLEQKLCVADLVISIFAVLGAMALFISGLGLGSFQTCRVRRSKNEPSKKI